MQTTSEEKGVSVEERNKLIAEFMGAVFQERKMGEYSMGMLWFYENPPTEDSSHNWDAYAMQYHSSWDWLMPVWKKAGAILFDIRCNLPHEEYMNAHLLTKGFIDACQKVNIDAAFHYVSHSVQFINAYNNLSQQSKS